MDKDNMIIMNTKNAEKYIIACLDTITDKDELKTFWILAGLDKSETDVLKFKCRLLKEVMGGQYFDLPNDWEDQCEVLEFMFIDGKWRWAKDIDKLKELANAL